MYGLETNIGHMGIQIQYGGGRMAAITQRQVGRGRSSFVAIN